MLTLSLPIQVYIVIVLPHSKPSGLPSSESPAMEQIAITALFLLLPLLYLILHRLFKSPSTLKGKPLPPGPHPWPIVGNIFHMGKKPHISMAHFADVHGPIISLRLGTQLLIVCSSPTAATEILKNKDRLFSARYLPQVVPVKGADLNRLPLIWAPTCTDQWKFLRSMCRTELFSPKAIDAQAILRKRKLNEMLTFLECKEGKAVKIAEVVFTAVFNTLANLFFSKDFLSFEDQGTASGLKGIIWRMMELGTAPNIADFYPLFRGMDPQGLAKQAVDCTNEFYKVWEDVIKERKKHRNDVQHEEKDFLDVMLANDFADDQINYLIVELFSAGVETSTTTIEWAMSDLLKNKEVMDKLQEELKSDQFNSENFLSESSISHLPYLNACVKETLRLHPPVPFLLPHRAPETCEVMDYTIPKDSQVFVNIWAIGRDPKIWNDPLLFKPERFLNSNLDFKGQDFEFLPFGAGRRMCPGLPMAARQVNLFLASLIHCYEWSLPNDEDPMQLDMNEKFGITLQKEQTLLVIPKKRRM